MALVPVESVALHKVRYNVNVATLRTATSGPIPNPPRDHAVHEGQYATTQEALDELRLSVRPCTLFFIHFQVSGIW